MGKKRTVTLTNRPPVTFDEDNWPLIASAHDSDHDNQYEFQANRTSKWFAGVRQHDDGRTIVYAKYYYSSAWRGERSLSAARGVLLTAEEDICAAIREVCNDICGCEHYGDDADRWDTLSDECQADMPAEVI
tara:strand:- start:33050 stop:33445 length:396 start_codon:yes stop_codon:yes gene_type:complete